MVFSAIELMAVVENVFVGGVEAGLYTVLHHLTGTRRTLKLLDLEKTDLQCRSFRSVDYLEINLKIEISRQIHQTKVGKSIRNN